MEALEKVVIVGMPLQEARARDAMALEEDAIVHEVHTVVLTKGNLHVLATVPLVLKASRTIEKRPFEGKKV